MLASFVRSSRPRTIKGFSPLAILAHEPYLVLTERRTGVLFHDSNELTPSRSLSDIGPRILLSGAAGSSISRETYGQDRRRDHDRPAPFVPMNPTSSGCCRPRRRSGCPRTIWHIFYRISVEALNLTPILQTYGGVTRGTAPYHPQLLVKILFYAYAVGIPASRQIAKELDENVAFRVLAANQRPDFRTISDFRRQHLTALADLFVEVLTLCRRAGLVTLGHIALDGTKLQANASKHKAMSYGRMGTEEARLQTEVTALLQQAEAADVHDDATYGADRRGDELPAELARREQRLQTIRAAKAVLEEEAQAEAALTQIAHTADATDRPRRGRPPQPPRSVPDPKAQRNFTDPESRIMPAPNAKGSVLQGYNCQAAVDATAQIVVAADVTDASE